MQWQQAFELADRLGVMNFGRLLEVGTPHELYQRPQTEFVATFLGTANLLVGEANSDGVRVGPLFSYAGRCSSSARACNGDWVNWSPPPRWSLEKDVRL